MMEKSRRLLAAAVAAVAVVAAATLPSAEAWTCACFQAQYEKSLYAVMTTSLYVPSRINGWGAPTNTWFAAAPDNCEIFNCSRKGEADDLGKAVRLTPPLPRREPPAAAAPIGPGSSVPCCLYAKSSTYYTTGIIAEAVNPSSGGQCESSLCACPPAILAAAAAAADPPPARRPAAQTPSRSSAAGAPTACSKCPLLSSRTAAAPVANQPRDPCPRNSDHSCYFVTFQTTGGRNATRDPSEE